MRGPLIIQALAFNDTHLFQPRKGVRTSMRLGWRCLGDGTLVPAVLDSVLEFLGATLDD